MINDYREIENRYIQNFSLKEEYGDYVRFFDDELPGMYAFNCIMIKPSCKSSITELLQNEIYGLKIRKKNFLKVLIHPGINIKEELKSEIASKGFEIRTNLYMRFNVENDAVFKVNDRCTVKIADSDKEFKNISELDIESSTESGIPQDFAIEKSIRKRAMYESKENNLEAYVSYFDGCPAGKCELFIHNDYAKIEDFDVLSKYQRQGIGTTMLKSMIEDALKQGIKNIYLIADKDDTPQNMYTKLGFEIIGEENELFYLQNG
ncbi:GNAT family N-acetyltransferase [Proteocatella sphenisci]|uniref:GNAT family N-acetyltransferase n=1 Tax=Proteocatella sphenisci TaxID=181070 RepID=UPI0004912FF0|nr:GNAT family N-acetyltransferase [Proteocatella sphenisci]